MPNSTLDGEFYAGVIETAWLLALLVVPLYFNKYAFNSFQPEKVFVVRSLALVVLGGWCLGRLAKRSHAKPAGGTASESDPLFADPVVRVVAAYALSVLVASATSIAPVHSFWGAYGRSMGTYTDLSCFVLFLGVAAHLRSGVQVSRLVTTVVLTSVPVSLYALGQRFGIDPIVVSRRVVEESRVGSTFGNPVFLAGYLILVLPLLIAKIWICARSVRPAPSRALSVLALVGYATFTVLGLIAVVSSGSRGALLGLLAGVAVMLLMMAAHSGVQRRVGIAALVTVTLLTVAAGGSWRYAASTDSPWLKRLQHIFDITSGAGLQRVLLWNMSKDVITSDQPLTMADGRPDSLRGLRSLAGYGPATVAFSTRRVVPGQLVAEYNAYVSPDSAHSQSWDLLLSTGLLGLLTWELLYACVVWYAFRLADVLPRSRANTWYWAAFSMCGLAGAFAFSASLGLAFVWLGFRFGTTLAFLLVLGVRTIAPSRTHASSEVDAMRLVLTAALCAAIVAHSIETAFSFQTETTETFFFIYIGLLVALKHTPTSLSGAARSARSELYVGGILGAMLLGSLGFDLLFKGRAASTLATIATTLTSAPGSGSLSTPWIAIGIAAVVVSFSACWSIDHCHDGRGRSIVRVGSLMTGIGLCFWLALASHLTSMRLLLPGQPSASADSLGDYLWLGHGFYLFGALMIGILALAVRRREDERRTAAATSLVSWGRRVWAAPVVITILAATYMLNLRQSDADVAAAKASQFKATRGWPLVTALYEVAVGKAPRTAFYREALGNALLQQAVGTTDPRARIAVLDNAERVLDAGARMYPLEAGFEANLGDVFLQKALLESDPRGRRTMATRAGQHLEIALRLEPSNFNSWTKAAYVDLALLDDSAAAAAKVRRSLAVHSTSDEALALAGDIDIAMTGRAREQNERRRLLEEAVGYYEKAIEHNASRYQYRAALARAHRALGRRDAAIDDYLRARERAPQTEWGEIDRAITQLRLERSE